MNSFLPLRSIMCIEIQVPTSFSFYLPKRLDESDALRKKILVTFIPLIMFETQFAQISTIVLPARVRMMKHVLMELTAIIVLLAMPALLGLVVLQVSYQVKADHIHTCIPF